MNKFPCIQYYFLGIALLVSPMSGSFADKRSVIQLAELHYVNGEITCDRDEPVIIRLKAVIYKTR
jgi:hypothetical protein